jgi:uncharacterized protein YbjT (DUF2867 family)
MSELDVVTGAFSFTGRHIADLLLAQGRNVRTLTRRPDPSHPLADRVERAPLVFDESLVDSLRGADTLYTTYWTRFEHGGATYEGAVANIGLLLDAATRAGVRRVVHISVANADEGSPFPYYRGKARAEALVRASGLSYAIVRPTFLFGPGDILVNDIAWMLRRAPMFLLPGDGRYEVQPVFVGDVAQICVQAGGTAEEVVVDAAGPHTFAFEDFVRRIKAAVRSRALIRTAPTSLALAGSRMLGLVVRDVVLTREEVDALEAGLLVSHEPAHGTTSFEDWLAGHADTLGRRYASELARNFRGHA